MFKRKQTNKVFRYLTLKLLSRLSDNQVSIIVDHAHFEKIARLEAKYGQGSDNGYKGSF